MADLRDSFDRCLPGMTGIEVLKGLRRTIDTHVTLILVLTANTSPNAAEEAMGAGVNAVTLKTVTPVDLAARVRHGLLAHGFGSSSKRRH